MCRFEAACLLSALTFLICANFSAANSLIDPYICGQPSCTPSGKFLYSTSKIYRYSYNVNVNTLFARASENISFLNVDSSVSLEFITPCEGLLKIKNVSMTDQDENYSEERTQAFAADLSQFPLRFAFHDGVITEICPADGELDWSLNFKRGALSLFQNTMGRFDMNYRGIERDIHGTCDTEYKMSGQLNTSLIVMKIKDLTQCFNRYEYLSILQSVRYNFQSKYQTWPVLQSESRCRIAIDHNIYTTVHCKERHLFEPFSGKQSGAMTTVVQNLKLVDEDEKTSNEIVEGKTDEWAGIHQRHNLLHHHSPLTRAGLGELKAAREILKNMCRIESAQSGAEEGDGTEGPEGAENMVLEGQWGGLVGLWGGLVRSCRGLTPAALSQLLRRAPTICPQARKHILDALPYIASIGSVELIKDMIMEGTVSLETRDEWLMSMALIPRPKKEMIESMHALMEYNPTDKGISLAASAMVHSYCRRSNISLDDCCQEEQNLHIIDILQSNVVGILHHNRTSILTRDQRDKVIISIKSLGNIGGFRDSFRDFLMTVIENTEIPLAIRIHSVEAFRRTPCVDTRSYFLSLFREQSLDVEVRLASYLQVMRCPSYVYLRKILLIFREEKINQVASFVWSHLENLGKSTIPSRVEKQGLLSGNTIPRPIHPPDTRKFSRNYEHGVFFDQYNAGGNYEANVIMSPESYIPRSASLNLTLDMFGESINILELNARGEGFEKYIEDIFKEGGPLNQARVDEHIKTLRYMRSSNNADAVREKVESMHYESEALHHQLPRLNLGMKVFGNEISYWSAEGDEEIRDAVSQLNPLNQIKKVLSGKEISYKKSSMFLDTTYSIPTGCGLPMAMNLMGTSVVNLNISGSISGDKNFFQTKSLEFEGKMHPSMALNVAATMSVNAGGHGGTGVRVNLRLHTATALTAHLTLQSGSHAAIRLSLPHSKQEIFQAKSELLILHGHKEIKQVGINKNKIEASTCSWKAVDTAIGIKVCATYEFPNMTDVPDAPYFIMAGPARYLLSLEKVDPSAKVYSFLYNWENTKNSKEISFSFDTPGSKTKRMFNSSISSKLESGIAQMVFESADMRFKAHATYKDQAGHKMLQCELDIDGTKQFDAVLSLTKQDQKNGYIYVPRLYVAVNNERIMELAGTLRFAQKKGVSQCDVSLEFQTKRLASRLIGYITWNGPSKGAKLRLDYQFLDERKETIKIDALVSNREMSAKQDFYGELGLEFTSYPHLNFFSELKYKATSYHLDCSWNLSTTRENKDKDSKFRYSIARHRTYDGYKIKHHLKLQKPALDLSFYYEEDGALSTVATTADYAGSLFGVWGRLYVPPGTQLYLEASLNATFPSLTPMVLQAQLHEKKPNEFDISAQGVWFTGTDGSLVAFYTDMSNPHLASRRIKAIISGSAFQEVIIDAKYTQDNRQFNFNAKGDQGDNSYSAVGHYLLHSEQNFTCYGQVQVKESLYSVNLMMDLFNDTSILADIHLDQLRDVHVTLVKINTPSIKKLNADINWDANRDPSQKLSVGLELLNKGVLNYGGSFLLFYPGRLINGEFNFLVKDWLCQWLVKLGWSPDDNILWRVKLYSEVQHETIYAILSEMDTPFQGWRDTSLNFVWRYVENYQAVNGNMTWEKERLVFGITADYMMKTNEVYGKLSALINSTIAALPALAAVASHRHLWRKSSDTLLSFEYNNDGLTMLNSSWRLDHNSTFNDISGRVAMRSPFVGYAKGLLVTKFSVSNKKDIFGLTHFNLEEKIYTVTVDGHMKRFTNSMLVINVTSPIPSYSLMAMRFGFSDSDRHLVALVETPGATTGLEMMLRLVSAQDFHVFGHIALPVDFLQNAMVQAKRNSEELDFRLGWGKLEFGFTGIWHYNSLADFQYLYKLFTPLKGFEENGMVLKNLYNNDLDSEISIGLSQHKLGLAASIKDHGKGLLKKIENLYYQKEEQKTTTQFVEDFSSDVYIALDTLYYTTISFDANINKYEGADEEEIFKVKAHLYLPDKPAITLTDKFVLEDFVTMTNDLYLETPFPAFKELKFFQIVNMVLGENYNISIYTNTNNNGQWLENSVFAYYNLEVGEDEEYTSHKIDLKVVSQLELLPSIHGSVDLHIQSPLMKVAVDIRMPSCQFRVAGQTESLDMFSHTVVSMNLTTPYTQPLKTYAEFKKDFSDMENTVLLGLQFQQGSQNNFVFSEVTVRPNSPNHLKLKIKASLIPIVPPSDLALAYSYEPQDRHRVLRAEARVGSRDVLYSLHADLQDLTCAVQLATPHRGFRKLNLTAHAKSDNTISGVFQGDTVTFNINGKIITRDPLELTVKLTPISDGETYTVRMKTGLTPNKFFLTTTIVGAIQFTIHTNVQNEKNLNEISFRIDSSNPNIKEVFLKSRLELTPDNHVKFDVQAVTPLRTLDRLNGDFDVALGSKSGEVLYHYNMTHLFGNGDLKWKLADHEMYLKVLTKSNLNGEDRSIDLNVYDVTNNQMPQIGGTGFHFQLDNTWSIGANSSVSKSAKTVERIFNIQLPRPNLDVHTLKVASIIPDENNLSALKTMDVQYYTDVTKNLLGANVKLTSVPNLNVKAVVKWGTGDNIKTVDNTLDVKAVPNAVTNRTSFGILYDLYTPLFKEEETLKLRGNYDIPKNEFIAVGGTLCYPASVKVVDLDLTYSGLKHTVGKINATTPFENLPWLATNARLFNRENIYENLVMLYWPNNTAIFNSTHNINHADGTYDQKGHIAMEIPVSTRHVIMADYSHVDGDKFSNGECNVLYNGDQFMHGEVKSVSDIGEQDLLRDTVDITIDSKMAPVGINYIHQYDDKGIHDIKQGSVYQLRNATNFNLTGRVDIEPWNTGKLIKLMVIQGQRTVRFENNYEAKDNEIFQGSKLQWAPNVWLNYDINVLNKTEGEDESQELKLNIVYPRRSFGLVADYRLRETLLEGGAALNWTLDTDNHHVKLDGSWENTAGNQHGVKLSLAHPSFSRDVTLLGRYSSEGSIMSNMSVVLEYSEFENERLTFNSLLIDNSNGPTRDYRFELDCKHPATNLDLEVKNDLNMRYKVYHVSNYYKYQKTLFYQTLKQGELLIDLQDHFMQYGTITDQDWYKLNATWSSIYPEYKVLVAVNRTTGEDNGIWIVSAKDKSILGHFNSTDDISYHVIGQVNDARSAELGAWRDFNDIKTIDVSSYIRLNHSRLLTSRIKWRPEIYQQLKNSGNKLLKYIYMETSEVIVLWKSIPIEAISVLKSVWSDAKPKFRTFLSDLNNLHVIKNDIDEFHTFLNDSYDENEFYIRDIVEFGVHVIDELSLRNHIESIPEIFNEMWQLMGQRGQSLRESIVWIIETIKKSYTELMEKINNFLEADLMDQVSNLIEAGILKYDSFIKQVHLTFLKYCETTWRSIVEKLTIFSRNLLKALEPFFLKVAHYVETFVWTFGKEVLDFFYARSNELTESPYFSVFASFIQDIDGFIRDMSENDAVTNIKKYSTLAWSFFNERILIHVPFQKELKEIASEIWEGINKLQELSYVQKIKLMFQEAKERLKWWYDYFKMGEALTTVADVLYEKITEVPRTALQNEGIHRKPKTMFLLEPKEGILLLEQKLPIPWHAFNRTPDFSQISEYRQMRDLFDDWFFSNVSMMSYFYDMKHYMDIRNLLPPFTGHAVVTGHGTVVTLDRQVFTLTQPGTFLLVSDFLHRNFSIFLESHTPRKYNIVLLGNKELITVNIFDETVTSGENTILSLPIELDNWIIDRDEEYISMQNTQGALVRCNYLFLTCKVNIDGWYYSRLGGLFGTMNNEPSDDLRTPDGKLALTIDDLVDSWRILDGSYKDFAHEQVAINETNCEAYFLNKVSPLKECFSSVDASLFYDQCMQGLDPCVLANTYMEICLVDHIPIRTPEKCMECLSPTGGMVEEGTFNFLLDTTNSTDVVFIVEAHPCNQNIRKEKNIDMLINTLESKFIENGLTNNRYTMVAFGGRGVYKTARSIYVQNQMFVNASDMASVFDHMQIDKPAMVNNVSLYRSDTFEALSFASTLSFRPGVSKTFILLPCTKCDIISMKLDYAVVHQVLMDSSITLHVIMHDEFAVSKKRIAKTLFGVDSSLAYTAKDVRELIGDAELKQQVKLPKAKLGFCISLAMETNGTLFSGKRMRSSEVGGGRRAASVLAARAARSSRPCPRARCECHAGRLRCAACPRHLPMRSPLSGDISLGIWESSEMDDFIDNFLDSSVPVSEV